MMNDKVREQRSDWLTNFCRTIGFITSFCALLCMMAFATSLFHDTVENQNNAAQTPKAIVPWEKFAHNASERVLRLAGVCSSIIIILTETEWERFLQFFAFMDYWIARGTFQIVIAALTQHAAHADGESDLAKSVSLYRNVASLCLAGCGAFYILSGVVCIGAMRRARRRREMERVKMLQDLQDVEAQLNDAERRRIELQSLLGPEGK
eukprot:CAMPEP_0118934606 /NCGR_PEP_ID=MMETSP1169-20130426/13918_1 /TAXON_ID=36882 /ORGANISM="Pyramimonas obovata, Strain CCMP722" /LENGTH=207 /DNA_ID=CAMNT_0006877527 /DNA_START=323 /DNA_END=946 /DNA_ORIENTATION=-